MSDTLEHQISDYVSSKDGPLRCERITTRAMGREWRDLSPDERGRVIRELRRCGFVQHKFPHWVRSSPREGALTEAEFHALVAFANSFADANGRSPLGLRDLATWLAKGDADAATVNGLFGLADDVATQTALVCAGYVRAAA
jgi:hypothetical protein